MCTYQESRRLAETTDLNNKDHFEFFGGGINKKAYGINGSEWIVLAASSEKRRIIKAEIEQMLIFKDKGVDIPKLGEAEIFDVTVNGQEKIAFLEEKINGFEIPRAGTAFSLDEVKEFGKKLIFFICEQTDLNTAKSKRAAALNSIDHLKTYLNEKDIPDFQVRLDTASGKILTLDPGDPLNSQNNAREKHLNWVNEWSTILNDKRYLARIWNEKNNGDKVTKEDWQ